MKTPALRPVLTGLCLASALTTLPVAVWAADTPADPAVAAPAKNDKNLSGKVEARSDTSLTIGGHTVALNSSTTYSRNGTSIGSADVKVGDVVNVVTTDDGQVAVSVDVTSSS